MGTIWFLRETSILARGNRDCMTILAYCSDSWMTKRTNSALQDRDESIERSDRWGLRYLVPIMRTVVGIEHNCRRIEYCCLDHTEANGLLKVSIEELWFVF